MLAFRSIIVAVAAFATMTCAIPTASPSPDGVSSLSKPPAPLPDILKGLPILGGLLGGRSCSGSICRRGDGHGSPGDILKTCSDGVAGLVVEIKAVVEVGGGADHVDHDKVVYLLGEILVLLQVALKELKLIVIADITLKGVACTLKELAEVVGGLVILIIEVVWLVVSILGLVEVALCKVVAAIGLILVDILEVVFILVVDLKVLVAVLIQPYFHECHDIGYEKILVFLGITA